MPAFLKTSPRILAAAFAAAALFLPVASRAQELPPYATAPAQDQQIHGRIESIDGTFNLTVRDDNGYLDAIQLRQGTIINPTGLTLAPGMIVTVIGYSGGSVFNANEIDTPYTYSGPAPTPVYYGAGWWYPGYAYGYGPSFSLGIVVGFGGGYSCYRTPWAGHWWGGSPGWYHGGGYAYGGSSHGGYGNGGSSHGGYGNGAPPSNGNYPHGGYGGQGSGFTGSGQHPGEPGNPISTEPRNPQPGPPYHPVPVVGTNPGYHAPSSGVTYHAPSYNPGTYRAPGGGYSGSYRAPVSGGSSHAAPAGGGYRGGGGGGFHAGGGGGGGAHR